MQPAGLRSIRWQLPLTYAAIALVAAVALSGLLIGILRQYYAQQEYEQLDSTSRGLASALGFRLNQPLNEDTLPDLLGAINFVPDFRVELLDPNGHTVFDTGFLDTFRVRFDAPDDIALQDSIAVPVTQDVPQLNRVQPMGPQEALPVTDVTFPADATFSVSGMADAGGGSSGSVMVYSQPVATVAPLTNNTTLALGTAGRPMFWQVASGAQFARMFFTAASMDEPLRERSGASVTRIITSTGGTVIGFVRLSNPPAIASGLIQSVTSGAIVAGIGAVLIAGILGWWVSLRLTRPLLALTEATARMTQGDLSARVDVPRSDELGALGDSFNAMAGKVEQTVAALRRFAADAAHELHTPLTALRTNLELSHERPDQARLLEAVGQIARLEALADDLLDLSRLEMAETPRRESVDVGALVREVSEVYASRAEQAGVDFALAMGESLPPVRANAALLRRALGNLLDNAVKFTPSGGDVSLAMLAGDGGVQFVVEDSGIGIPSDDLPALFSRFHRGSNTSEYPGSGLGLAIVKAIADVHHGTVAAENTAKGARFVLTFPVIAVT